MDWVYPEDEKQANLLRSRKDESQKILQLDRGINSASIPSDYPSASIRTIFADGKRRRFAE